LAQKFANNRTLEKGIIKGVETNSTPKYRKNSPNWTKLETGVNNIWVSDLYEKIVDINNLKTFRLLEFFQNAA